MRGARALSHRGGHLISASGGSGASRKSWAELREGLGVLLAARPMWCTSTLFFLLSFSPGFQTPLFYYQTNMLGFSPRFIGTLTLLGSAMSIAGTVPYPWLSRRVGLRPLMIVSVVLDALIHAMYAFYESPASAVVISSAAGLIRGFVWMPILDLLARSVPRGHEAVGSALSGPPRMLRWRYPTWQAPGSTRPLG